MNERSENVVLPTETRYFAFVDCAGHEEGCGGCGTVGLTQAEYDRQMDRPDATWRCPRCGAYATYNDELSEEAQGVNDEPPEPDGECFRGGEYESAVAQAQANIMRDLK